MIETGSTHAVLSDNKNVKKFLFLWPTEDTAV